jgi:hypothetical protein
MPAAPFLSWYGLPVDPYGEAPQQIDLDSHPLLLSEAKPDAGSY